MMRSVTRTLMVILGWALLIPGLVFVALPPPFAFGIFMVLPGVAILVAYSKGMRRLVQRIRARHHLVDTSMSSIETRAPGPLGRSLRRTNPAALIRSIRSKRRKKKAHSDSLTPAASKTEGNTDG